MRLHHEDQTGNTGLFVTPPPQAMRISLPGLFYRHCPQPDSDQSSTLALTVLRSYGERVCVTLFRCLPNVFHHISDEVKNELRQLLVATNGSLGSGACEVVVSRIGRHTRKVQENSHEKRLAMTVSHDEADRQGNIHSRRPAEAKRTLA